MCSAKDIVKKNWTKNNKTILFVKMWIGQIRFEFELLSHITRIEWAIWPIEMKQLASWNWAELNRNFNCFLDFHPMGKAQFIYKLTRPVMTTSWGYHTFFEINTNSSKLCFFPFLSQILIGLCNFYQIDWHNQLISF